jgi:hypothetical protein
MESSSRLKFKSGLHFQKIIILNDLMGYKAGQVGLFIRRIDLINLKLISSKSIVEHVAKVSEVIREAIINWGKLRKNSAFVKLDCGINLLI